MGLRRAEIANIKLADITEDGKLKIRGKGHGDGKYRELVIPSAVRKAVDAYLPVRADILSVFGDRSEGNLLVQSKKFKGCPFTSSCVEDVVNDMSAKAGVEMTAHSMRRLYATTLYDKGVDLNTLRVMMRHADLRTTMECYLNVDPRKVKTAVDQVSDELFD